MPVVKTDSESIIKQSIHLFKVHGYYSTTMATIGEACGLIKGSIYHHFKSKEALALACLQYIHQHFEKDIFAVAYRAELSAKVRLELMTVKVEDYFLHSEGGCLLGNFALELANNIPRLKQEIVDYFNAWEQALVAIFTDAIPAEQARASAAQVVAWVQGSVMMMRLNNDVDAFKAQNLRILQML